MPKTIVTRAQTRGPLKPSKYAGLSFKERAARKRQEMIDQGLEPIDYLAVYREQKFKILLEKNKRLGITGPVILNPPRPPPPKDGKVYMTAKQRIDALRRIGRTHVRSSVGIPEIDRRRANLLQVSEEPRKKYDREGEEWRASDEDASSDTCDSSEDPTSSEEDSEEDDEGSDYDETPAKRTKVANPKKTKARGKRAYKTDGKHKCANCKYTTNRKSNFTKHIRTHTGERPYKCTHCTKAFKESGDLTRHIRTHTDERPYKCTHCTKAFSRSGDLTNHIRTHTGERPYKCTHCTKAFTESGHLTNHIRTHTGERPYKCTHCTKAFTQSGHLTKHIRTHTGERPYKCTHCTKAFTQSGDLARHIRTVHDKSKKHGRG